MTLYFGFFNSHLPFQSLKNPKIELIQVTFQYFVAFKVCMFYGWVKSRQLEKHCVAHSTSKLRGGYCKEYLLHSLGKPIRGKERGQRL